MAPDNAFQDFSRLKRVSFLSMLALVLTWVLFAPATVFAQDYITQRGWLEDPRGEFSWAEVQQQVPKSFEGPLSRGFGSSVIWIRLRIDPKAHPIRPNAQDRLVLRIRPVYLDDIRVYDPLAPGKVAGITGDAHHPREDEFQGMDFLVPISRGTQARDIWLRLTSTSTRQIDVQALNIDDLNHVTHTRSLAFSGYVGLVMILAIWGIVYWLFSRDAVIGAFAIMQICALLFALSSLGYLRVVWPAAWPARTLHEVTTIFSITSVTAAEWFHIQLLRELSPPRLVFRILLCLIALLPIKILMLMLDWTTMALRVNMLEVLVVPVLCLGAVFFAKGWDTYQQHGPALSRRVMVCFYILLLVVMMGAALPGLGIISSNEIGLYIVQLHGLVIAFLVLLMLQYRARVLHLQQREISMVLERSLLQTQQERTIREEQEKLLTMLAHELKTPLATMHMRLDNSVSGTREIKKAIRDMNNVIDRCQQTLLLSDRQLVPNIESVDIVALLQSAVASSAQPERMQLELPPEIFIETDPQLFFSVINNLLENACKYAAPDTPIAISLTDTGTTTEAAGITLEIANEPGLAGWPDSRMLFSKYYRSPHAKRQTGTGLGMYLVRNLMHALDGYIEYAPSENAVRFLIFLPNQPNKKSVVN